MITYQDFNQNIESGPVFATDPISNGKCTVTGAYISNGYYVVDDEPLECTATFAIAAGDPFFARIQETPLKIQNHPLVLEIGGESHLIKISRIEKFERTEEGINLYGVTFQFMETLAFFEEVQDYRWKNFERKK